eukprot:3415228-Pyramimonas_sp.AAC.3
MSKYTEVDPFNYNIYIYTDASVPGERMTAAWSMALISKSEDGSHFHWTNRTIDQWKHGAGDI